MSIEILSERPIGYINSSLSVNALSASPNLRRIAYAVEVSEGFSTVVIDGKTVGTYNKIVENALVFSPDNKRIAYGALLWGKGLRMDSWFVVVDGEEGKKYDEIDGLVFCPDSKRVAYGAKTARIGKDRFLVVNGEEGKLHKSLLIQSEGVIIFDSPNNFHYFASEEDDHIYLVEGKIS